MRERVRDLMRERVRNLRKEREKGLRRERVRKATLRGELLKQGRMLNKGHHYNRGTRQSLLTDEKEGKTHIINHTHLQINGARSPAQSRPVQV